MKLRRDCLSHWNQNLKCVWKWSAKMPTIYVLGVSTKQVVFAIVKCVQNLNSVESVKKKRLLKAFTKYQISNWGCNRRVHLHSFEIIIITISKTRLLGESLWQSQ